MIKHKEVSMFDKVEEWKPVKGYEGLYEVSSWGRVKSKKRDVVLKTQMDKKGYIRCSLQKDGKLSTFKVHRLVGQHFIPNPENKPQINHINSIKHENNIDNLEWCTNLENQRDAISKGLVPHMKGELNGFSKLTEKDVLEIRAKFKPRIYTRQMLADEYGVKEGTIKDVLQRRSWKHI